MTAQPPDAALARRDAILQAVSYAASGFLRAGDWRESTQRLLGQLGVATDVHRIYVFENGTGPNGELTASQRFEWVATGVSPQIDNPELQDVPYEAGFSRWEAILRAGDVVVSVVRRLPEDERAFLAAQGILSILVVPIFAGDAWWGFMGFDDCATERQWSPGELEALRAAAGALGAAVHRRHTEEALRASEDQLRQAHKMEAIGQLAGGVAHDFNNLLTVILGHVELLLEEAADGAAGREDLIAIREASLRAAGLTQQLLAFSRRQVLQPAVVDVNTVVGGVMGMLRRVIPEDIAIVTDLDAAAGSVLADPRQLEQVVLNLVVNARDAMPRGGRITLVTKPVELDAEAVRDRAGQQPGRYCMVAVSDTGVGMDKGTLARIFEPFFTTKAAGKGTGLGLSTVYGIVKQSGGWVWCYSEVDHGTTFKVYLPPADRAAAAAAARAPEAAATRPPPRAAGTILLVEDDEAVRRLAQRILTRAGYEVRESSSGAEALAELRRGGDPPALLLTDLLMPDMSGRQLAEQVRATYPATRVLYASGYTDDDLFRRGLIAPDAAFLEKPFTHATLLDAVQRALGRSARPRDRAGLGDPGGISHDR